LPTRSAFPRPIAAIRDPPRRRYQALLHHADSPQLPSGYAAVFLLALCPPLWFSIVDPRVRAFRSTVGSR